MFRTMLAPLVIIAAAMVACNPFSEEERSELENQVRDYVAVLSEGNSTRAWLMLSSRCRSEIGERDFYQSVTAISHAAGANLTVDDYSEEIVSGREILNGLVIHETAIVTYRLGHPDLDRLTQRWVYAGSGGAQRWAMDSC